MTTEPLKKLDFTLIADGSSDAILIQPVCWLLRQHLKFPINGTWADLRRLPSPPRDLHGKILKAIELYPCDMLFVHRDAEGQPHAERVKEISAVIAGLQIRPVPIVPIRMQETWLLIDEQALRRAAGNPNGRAILEMPDIDRLENLPDPKRVLHDLLLTASEHTGRRRQKFNPGRQALRLGELIEDYGPLRRLYAFQQVEAAIRSALDEAALPESRD